MKNEPIANSIARHSSLITHHRSRELGPWIYQTLAMEDDLDRLEPELRGQLRQSYLTTTARNLTLLQELETLLPSLGARVLLLKGVALLPYYRRIGMRRLSDADLLVSPADVAVVRERLLAAGFASEPIHNEGYDRSYYHEMAFSRTEDDRLIRIDLHWGLVTVEWLPQAGLPPFDDLWGRSRSAPFGGPRVHVLRPEDNLLHICLHVAMHHSFEGELPYLDIAQLVRGEGDSFDWRLFVGLAVHSRWKPAVYLALMRARAIAAAPVPETVIRQLTPSGARRWLLERLVGVSHQPQAGQTMGEQASRVLQLALAEGPGEGVAMVRYAVFPPLAWLRSRYPGKDRAGLAGLRLLHLARLARLSSMGLLQLFPGGVSRGAREQF